MASIFIFSCGEYEALAIEKESKRLADSLFRAHRDSLDKMADKLCDKNFKEYYDHALDSLKETQLKKIKILIQK
ncbi:MAG: hypothetical protein KJO29_12325 [Bacteroidia bacterium]|nr:hypothetical protein [Bacteroidia bacterium]